MKKPVKTIKQTVVIPASPKEVYEAYVDPAKQSEFTERKPRANPQWAENIALGTDMLSVNIFSWNQVSA